MKTLPHDVYIALLVTERCNHSCHHCIYKRHLTKRRDMPFDTIKETLTILESIDFPGRIYLSGGEPTLHSCFNEILRYFQCSSLRIYLASNGSWIETDSSLNPITVAIVEAAKKCNTFQLRITVDYPHYQEDNFIPLRIASFLNDAKFFCFVRGRNFAFKLTASSLEECYEFAKTIGLLKYGLHHIEKEWNPTLTEEDALEDGVDFIVIDPSGNVYKNNYHFYKNIPTGDLQLLPSIIVEQTNRLAELR